MYGTEYLYITYYMCVNWCVLYRVQVLLYRYLYVDTHVIISLI